MEELLPHVELSDIDKAYHPVIELIGIDAFVKICQYYMGDEVYFPKADSLTRKARNRIIVQEFNGHNVKYLSKKYGITPRQIRNIIENSKCIEK